jgi:hypothetical protein
MKGDLTRSTFDKKKDYVRLNMQQGRVEVDADAREQCALNEQRSDMRSVKCCSCGTAYDYTFTQCPICRRRP